MNDRPEPRRLEEVAPPSERDPFDRLVADVARLPRTITYGGSTAIGLIIANQLGLRASAVLSDPYVFFFVRTFAIIVFAVAILVGAWVGLSVISHIKNRRWIRRIAGYEPQALHRGASSVEDAYNQQREVTFDALDANAALAAQLEITEIHRRALEAENGALRRELDQRLGADG